MDGLKSNNEAIGEWCLFQTKRDDDGKWRWRLGETESETAHDTPAGATLEFCALAAEGRIKVEVLPPKKEDEEETK